MLQTQCAHFAALTRRRAALAIEGCSGARRLHGCEVLGAAQRASSGTDVMLASQETLEVRRQGAHKGAERPPSKTAGVRADAVHGGGLNVHRHRRYPYAPRRPPRVDAEQA